MYSGLTRVLSVYSVCVQCCYLQSSEAVCHQQDLKKIILDQLCSTQVHTIYKSKVHVICIDLLIAENETGLAGSAGPTARSTGSASNTADKCSQTGVARLEDIN